MLKAACLIARKDLRLVLSRGAGLVQALLLGLLLIFVFSLSRETGETMSGQGAATIFWLSSAFCQVLSFNMLYGLEEANGSRAGLLLLPSPVQSVLLGKAAAGLCIILTAQLLFLPATIVFLGQSLGDGWDAGPARPRSYRHRHGVARFAARRAVARAGRAGVAAVHRAFPADHPHPAGGYPRLQPGVQRSAARKAWNHGSASPWPLTRCSLPPGLSSSPLSFQETNNLMRYTWMLPCAVLGGVLMAACQVLIYRYAPVEQTMGLVQKIFYTHLPLAWWSFVSFFLVCVSGVAYLKTRNRHWDAVAGAAAEVGVVLSGLALVSGSIWARHSWGVWWTWDPRLTTTMILWFLYAGYLVLRKMDMPRERQANLCAVVGIVAFVDVPLVFLSARLWRSIHPAVFANKSGGLEPEMKIAAIAAVACFGLVWAGLVGLRTLQIKQKERLDGPRRSWRVVI